MESSLGKGAELPNFIIFQLNARPGAQLDIVFQSDSVTDRAASLVGMSSQHSVPIPDGARLPIKLLGWMTRV